MKYPIFSESRSILDFKAKTKAYEGKSEQAHIPHDPPLLENAAYNKWQFQALVRGNQIENQFHLSCTK